MSRKTREWFHINVIGHQTNHVFAPDIVNIISAALKRYGIPKHEVVFECWGAEPDARGEGATNHRVDKTRLSK